MEHFSGAAVLTKAARKAGYNAAAVDKINSPGMDILKPSGFGLLRLPTTVHISAFRFIIHMQTYNVICVGVALLQDIPGCNPHGT